MSSSGLGLGLVVSVSNSQILWIYLWEYLWVKILVDLCWPVGHEVMSPGQALVCTSTCHKYPHVFKNKILFRSYFGLVLFLIGWTLNWTPGKICNIFWKRKKNTAQHHSHSHFKGKSWTCQQLQAGFFCTGQKCEALLRKRFPPWPSSKLNQNISTYFPQHHIPTIKHPHSTPTQT